MEYSVHCDTETHDMIQVVCPRSHQTAPGGKALSNLLGKSHLRWLISIKLVVTSFAPFFRSKITPKKVLDSKHLFHATLSQQTHKTTKNQNRSLARMPLPGDRKWNIMPFIRVFRFGLIISKWRVNIWNADQAKLLKCVPNSKHVSDNSGIRQNF